jgi:hypothetical protein
MTWGIDLGRNEVELFAGGGLSTAPPVGVGESSSAGRSSGGELGRRSWWRLLGQRWPACGEVLACRGRQSALAHFGNVS